MMTTIVEAFFTPIKGIVRYMGPVCTPGIATLIDEIKLMVSYYNYPRITVEIDSPGGEMQSLFYYLDNLAVWQRQGLIIETLALSQCASAAAYMLSMGTLGYRMAMPRSSLLYHNVRVYGSEQPLTSSRLGEMRQKLAESDAGLLVEMIGHLHPDANIDILRLLVCRLPYQPVSKADLAAFDGTGDVATKKAYRELVKSMDSEVRLSFCKKMGLFLRQSVVDGSDKNLMWLFQKYELFQSLFEQDTQISPQKAFELGLIDKIGVSHAD